MKRTILLAAALLLLGAPARAQTPPPWSAPGSDCANYFTTTEDFSIKFRREEAEKPDNGYSELPARMRAELKALIAECYYTRGDHANAIRYYRVLLDEWFGKQKRFFTVPNASGMTDADTSLDGAVILWHGALAFEKTGDLATARKFIDMAYDQIQTYTESARDKRIAADYKRLDPKRPAQLAAKQAAADREEDRRNAAAAAAYAKQFKGDRHKVALANGRPCRKATSDSALGHIEIWYYGCYASGGIGNESFTFRNGTLVEHATS